MFTKYLQIIQIIFLFLTSSSGALVINQQRLQDTPISNTYSFTQAMDNLLAKSFDEDERSRVSVYIYNVETGECYIYQPNLQYDTASTIKVPIAMYIYDLAQSHPTIMQETLEYTPEMYAEGAGNLQYTPFYTSYSVETLLHESIIESDNVATNMLLHRFFTNPHDPSTELIKYFGNADYVTHYSTAINKMTALSYLYLNQKKYPALLADMKHTTYDFVSLYFPEDVEIAHKSGALNATIHEYGIVYAQTTYLFSYSFDAITDEESRMQTFAFDVYNIITLNQ